MQTVRQCGFADGLRQWVRGGTVYIGVSAGAYLATPDIGYVTCLEDNNLSKECLETFEALGLVSDILICHADHYSPAQYARCEDVSGKNSCLIGDGGLVTVCDGEWDTIVF